MGLNCDGVTVNMWDGGWRTHKETPGYTTVTLYLFWSDWNGVIKWWLDWTGLYMLILSSPNTTSYWWGECFPIQNHDRFGLHSVYAWKVQSLNDWNGYTSECTTEITVDPENWDTRLDYAPKQVRWKRYRLDPCHNKCACFSRKKI